MRFIAFVFVLLLPLSVQSADALIVPLFTPKPVYPPALIRSRYTGKVRVQLVVSSGGNVQDVRAIESGHPQLTEAAVGALAQWRYRPWAGTVGAPPQISIMIPVIFGSHGNSHFNQEVDVGLSNIRCAYLNNEVDTQNRDFPEEPLNKVDVFWYTGQFLFSSYAALLRSEDERKLLLEQLGRLVPEIVKSCRLNPEHRYGDYLPVSIKSLLSGLAQSDDVPGALQGAL
ncbi:energy transducer TonB [Pseudomonas cichorii]|uniref:energy transducer TonB n=1 Tax=Pseudomonas cichorii TaxID=36746 RepID=UPI0003DFF6A9|nr:energy transducer TonB [Pseudomonas cichorii]AHF65403.1 TonB domain-containing protein [Pseudomonas cichorii JBC1]QVE17419.1 energy transducer TonB [Pseudomonas cichorii]SDO47816.1 TonB family C-terminal domain-containing protein [Pseudomonas cichorii]